MAAGQKSFEKLKLHVKKSNGHNIWTCEVFGPRKTKTLKGYMLKNPATYSQLRCWIIPISNFVRVRMITSYHWIVALRSGLPNYGGLTLLMTACDWAARPAK